MSEVAGRPPRASISPREALDWLRRPGPSVVLGLALMALLGYGKAVAVWRTGIFFDTDDAMRLVQLRDWQAGQAFGDLVQHRMDPPTGVAMHWSRVVDLPLAALLTAFSAWLGPDVGARATRLAFPALVAAIYLTLLVALARRLTDARGGLVAVLIAVCAIATNHQFDPGRIDHHAPQIALMLAMALGMIVALDPARPRAGAAAGLAAALSLAISVENVPFIAAAGLVFGLAAVISTARAPAAALFGGALAIGAALAHAFFAVDPAARACDAFSLFHLSAAIGGGGGLVALALAARAGAAPAVRAGLAALIGLGLALALGRAFPACLGSPLADLPDELRRHWLDHVTEARPLSILLARRPDLGLPVAAPIVAGLLAALFAAARGTGLARARWAALAALLAAGLAATFWQVRAASSTLPLAALAGAFAALAVADRLAAIDRPLARLAPALAAAPFASLVWLAAIPAPARLAAAPAASPAACFAPAAYGALAAEPPGIALSSVDAGAFILAYTRHAALAGAYHRNRVGNLAAIRALMAEPAAARDIVTRSGATFVAICRDLVDVQIYAEDAPAGLAARLMAGETPDWLERRPGAGPLLVWRVR
ncbi:MAG: hypothetical protein JNK46_07200 [Methylobacteriaceae bacterium]|nr:hypothetical protein [Methylobacteriaceae bacterium]